MAASIRKQLYFLTTSRAGGRSCRRSKHWNISYVIRRFSNLLSAIELRSPGFVNPLKSSGHQS
eukprot:4286783-Prymnesium_polylepis.1